MATAPKTSDSRKKTSLKIATKVHQQKYQQKSCYRRPFQKQENRSIWKGNLLYLSSCFIPMSGSFSVPELFQNTRSLRCTSGLGSTQIEKKRFFLTVYSNATLFCQSFPRRVPSNNSEGSWDGRRSKSSDLYQQHMQWNKKLPKNYLFRFCSYMLTYYPRLRRRTDWLRRLMLGKLTHFYPPTCLLHPA